MADLNPKPWGETTIVGKGIPKIDGRERLSGAAHYGLDMDFPNMLYAATLRCPHAHARVVKVDLAKAREMPGVRAILSDADKEANIPWYRQFGPPGTPNQALSRLFDPHCRHEGEEVAVVAAETQQQAWDAVRAIQVQYEKLSFVTNMEDALKPGAPAVQEGSNRAGQPSVYTRGDVAKGFVEADAVVEETYRTSCELHTPLEVHGATVRWDGDHLTVWESTQSPFDIQRGVAQALGLPLSKVRVTCRYMGGGFGSKQDTTKHTVIAALLARKTGRPVKYFLSREETFLCVGNRPAHSMTLKAGVKKDGTLVALELTGVGEVGAYPADTSVGGMLRELYTCPNMKITEDQAYINAGQNRAFRAPGYTQCAWALEQMMDTLADKIGMDPVELRLKNVAMVCATEQNRPYTSNGLPQCLTEGAKAFGWKEARARAKPAGPTVRGVGVASGMWGYLGPPRATAILRYYRDGSVNLNVGAADIGTGMRTVMAQVVVEELGVPIERIEVENGDTGTTQPADAASGSRTVMISSPAVRAACLDVKSKLLEAAAEQLKTPVADLTLKNGEVIGPAGTLRTPVQQIRLMQQQQVVVGLGVRGPHPTDKSIRPFATHFAEVEVNKRTGEVRVLRMLAAHDSGRVMNLMTYANQVIGGLTMGIGFALTEQRILDANTGKMVNANWHDYKIPTAMDVPAELTCLPIDPHDSEVNSTGAKGLGEPALIPAAAAIANAFHHATGLRATAAPLTPSSVINLLNQVGKRG
ncbi:MAG: xanthine dehydrogenase family protein molybdopterin-binding subunit [Bryobacteraceae bacterium]|jgi:xanthine dehydrogenase YagR molybdenum-binding subunit